MHRPLLVAARLSGPLAGEPPRLDALLEYVLSLHHGKGVPGFKVDRQYPAPPQGEIPIPLAHGALGPWKIARCSDPVLTLDAAQTVEHVVKKIGVENALLLAPRERLQVSTTNSWTKSYRLPLRVRLVPEVRWFAHGHRRELLQVLKRVPAVGKKIADGYGRVAEWTVAEVPDDWSWYAATDHGCLLMRTLPLGPWFPEDRVVGWRRDFGGVCPPYWHPDRYCEIGVPC